MLLLGATLVVLMIMAVKNTVIFKKCFNVTHRLTDREAL